MKKIILVLFIVGLVTVVVLFFCGSFRFSSTTKINDRTNQYSDKINGYSFQYPSYFKFAQDFGGMTKISNTINGTQLMFTFMNSDYVDMCTSQERFISNPLNIPGETYSKEFRNQDVIYKYFELNKPSSPGYLAKYSIVHGNKCLDISEGNDIQDFSILDSILDSVTFK